MNDEISHSKFVLVDPIINELRKCEEKNRVNGQNSNFIIIFHLIFFAERILYQLYIYLTRSCSVALD